MSQELIVKNVDSIITAKHKVVKKFYANEKGFSILEEKYFKKNDIVEIIFVNGKTSSIDVDSLNYKLVHNSKYWITLTSTFGNYFTYQLTRKKKGLTVKYRERQITSYYIELPVAKAKQFLREIW